MATFLDIGLIQHFQVIFPVLLIFVLVFVLLGKSQMFGDNKGMHSLIALCLAIMMLFVPGVIQVFSIMAPWFVIIIVGIFFFMLILLFVGVKPSVLVDDVSGKWTSIHYFLLVVALVIFIGALGTVYGSSMLPFSNEGNVTAANVDTSTDTGDFNQNVGRVIFHPKTIGMVFILLVASFTIRLMGTVAKKS